VVLSYPPAFFAVDSHWVDLSRLALERISSLPDLAVIHQSWLPHRSRWMWHALLLGIAGTIRLVAASSV
jgi:hypothetical protein